MVDYIWQCLVIVIAKRIFKWNNCIRTECKFVFFSCLLVSQSTWLLNNSQSSFIRIMLITLGHTLRGGPLFQSFIECKSMSFPELLFIDYWWLYMTMKKPVTSMVCLPECPGLFTWMSLGKSFVFLNLISNSWRNYSHSKLSCLPSISGSPQGESYLLVNQSATQFTSYALLVNTKAGCLMVLLAFWKPLSLLLTFLSTQSPCFTLGQGSLLVII